MSNQRDILARYGGTVLNAGLELFWGGGTLMKFGSIEFQRTTFKNLALTRMRTNAFGVDSGTGLPVGPCTAYFKFSNGTPNDVSMNVQKIVLPTGISTFDSEVYSVDCNEQRDWVGFLQLVSQSNYVSTAGVGDLPTGADTGFQSVSFEFVAW